MGIGRAKDLSSDSSGRRFKLGRLIQEYDLAPLGAEFERWWTADGDDRSSLRELATDVNRRMLAAVMTEADMHPLDGEVANAYRLLTADDVTDGERTRIRRRLERNGVDVATLREDFVTYQAVRTYLTEHRDAEYTRPDRDRTADCAEGIQRLRGRITSVTEGKLDQLRAADEITLGEFRTLVDVTVICKDCATRPTWPTCSSAAGVPVASHRASDGKLGHSVKMRMLAPFSRRVVSRVSPGWPASSAASSSAAVCRAAGLWGASAGQRYASTVGTCSSP